MPTEHELRAAMVSDQLSRRGIRDPRVLEAMGSVPRHAFVPEVSLAKAYADHPLPIGYGQTISQPYMVARMTELLAPRSTDRILEVGAGSGYQTAILAKLCHHVYAMERIEALSARAIKLLAMLNINNISWVTGDGSLGWPSESPFDGVLVAAGAPRIPEPLKDQVVQGGRLVIPVGQKVLQELQVVTIGPERHLVERDVACRFVSLIGQDAWQQ